MLSIEPPSVSLYSLAPLPLSSEVPSIARPQSMSDSSDQSWSNNPNAPQIPYQIHTWEKEYFSGEVLATVAYGTPSYVSAYPC
jgi:hypothetical protein